MRYLGIRFYLLRGTILIVTQLIHGIPPWDAESEYKLIQNIEHQPVKFSIPISPITKDFISRCLAVKERDRMSWDELLRHQMFNGKFAKVVKEKH
jgi:serine/threonine protein kinase